MLLRGCGRCGRRRDRAALGDGAGRSVDGRDDLLGLADAAKLKSVVVGAGGVEVDGADLQDALDERLAVLTFWTRSRRVCWTCGR